MTSWEIGGMSDDRAERFGGVGRLLGTAALEKLYAAHVVVTIGVEAIGLIDR